MLSTNVFYLKVKVVSEILLSKIRTIGTVFFRVKASVVKHSFVCVDSAAVKV